MEAHSKQGETMFSLRWKNENNLCPWLALNFQLFPIIKCKNKLCQLEINFCLSKKENSYSCPSQSFHLKGTVNLKETVNQ